jgi:ADP-heptose:LPS heptosyltransferase
MRPWGSVEILCDHGAVSDRGNPHMRWADRWLGVPALALLGKVHTRRVLPVDIRRIGLLKMAAIGDTVLLSAAVVDLAAAFPEVELVLFVGGDNAGAAALIEGLGEVVVLEASRPVRSVRELRRHHLDVLLDFGSWTRLEALYSALSGARFTVGFCTTGQSRHACQDVSVEHAATLHEVENYRQLVRQLGIVPVSVPSLRPPAVLAAERRPSGPYVVLHPWPGGYRSERKEWPADRWVELAGHLSAAGLGVVLSGGAIDAPGSSRLSAQLASVCEVVVDTAGRLSLGEVLDLVAGSDCVISVNTGIMHMAAASGAPTVGLNGPTSSERWGPIGPFTVSVNSSFDGCGYLNLGSEYEGRRDDCMLGISVDDVADAAFTLMSQAGHARNRTPAKEASGG